MGVVTSNNASHFLSSALIACATLFRNVLKSLILRAESEPSVVVPNAALAVIAIPVGSPE